MMYASDMTIDERNEPATKGFVLEAIEGLARMMNAGFQSLENKLDLRIDSLDHRIDGLTQDIANLTERVDNLEKIVMGMWDYFDVIFAELRMIRNEIKEVDTRKEVADLQVRVSVIEEKIHRKRLA